jgi:hypothetical protein
LETSQRAYSPLFPGGANELEIDTTSLNLGDSQPSGISRTVGFFKWSTIIQKPRHSEEMVAWEQSLLFHRACGMLLKESLAKIDGPVEMS